MILPNHDTAGSEMRFHQAQNQPCTVVEEQQDGVDLAEVDKILQDLEVSASCPHRDGSEILVGKSLERLYDILVRPICHILNVMRSEDKLVILGGKVRKGIITRVLIRN